MKQYVREYSTEEVLPELKGSFFEVQDAINRFKSQGWEGIEQTGYGYDGGVDFALFKYRLETDDEYNHRLKREAFEEKQREQAKKNQEWRRRKMYEQLKKEFEG
jgi:hypothetical protein